MLKEFWEREKQGHEKEVRVLLTHLREFEMLPFVLGGMIGFSQASGQSPKRKLLAFWSPTQLPPKGDQFDTYPQMIVTEEVSLLTLHFVDGQITLNPWACAVLKLAMEVVNGKRD